MKQNWKHESWPSDVIFPVDNIVKAIQKGANGNKGHYQHKGYKTRLLSMEFCIKKNLPVNFQCIHSISNKAQSCYNAAHDYKATDVL